jgi:hypothetical protein
MLLLGKEKLAVELDLKNYTENKKAQIMSEICRDFHIKAGS